MIATDNVWVVIGASLGGLAVLAAVIVLAVRRMRHDPFEDQRPPDEPEDPDRPDSRP